MRGLSSKRANEARDASHANLRDWRSSFAGGVLGLRTRDVLRPENKRSDPPSAVEPAQVAPPPRAPKKQVTLSVCCLGTIPELWWSGEHRIPLPHGRQERAGGSCKRLARLHSGRFVDIRLRRVPEIRNVYWGRSRMRHRPNSALADRHRFGSAGGQELTRDFAGTDAFANGRESTA